MVALKAARTQLGSSPASLLPRSVKRLWGAAAQIASETDRLARVRALGQLPRIDFRGAARRVDLSTLEYRP